MIPETSSDGTPAPAPESVTTAATAPAPAPAGDAATVEPVTADPATADDAVVLDQLEADLTAVEHAISTLDRVTAEGVGGESAASQIAVAVSAERFGIEAVADSPETPA